VDIKEGARKRWREWSRSRLPIHARELAVSAATSDSRSSSETWLIGNNSRRKVLSISSIYRRRFRAASSILSSELSSTWTAEMRQQRSSDSPTSLTSSSSSAAYVTVLSLLCLLLASDVTEAGTQWLFIWTRCAQSTTSTRSTGTVHTSAKAHLTSVAISVPPSCESVRDRHRNLIICSLAHCQPSLNISCKSVWKFLHKVANRQTNNDESITSLAEVTSISCRLAASRRRCCKQIKWMLSVINLRPN